MGSLQGLNKTFVDVTERILPFVDEDEGLAISEAIMAPKPKSNPAAKPFLYWDGERYPRISNLSKWNGCFVVS